MRGFGASVPPREALILVTVLNHPWLLEAHAEQKEPRAIEALAWCKLNGVGWPADPIAAFFLYGEAAQLGVPAANGLSMLVHQGAQALEIWTGAAVPVSAMRAALPAF